MGCVRGGRRPREKSREIKDFIGARVETSSVRPSVGVRLLFSIDSLCCAQRRLRFFDVWWQSDAEADVSVDRNVASVLGDGRVAYT